MNEEEMRKAFEAWAADYYRMKNFSRDMDYDGSYIQPINNEWEAFQAAYQLQQKRIDALIECMQRYISATEEIQAILTQGKS